MAEIIAILHIYRTYFIHMIHDGRHPPIRIGAGPMYAYGCSAVLGAGCMGRGGALDLSAFEFSGIIACGDANFSRGPAVRPFLTPHGARVAHVTPLRRCRKARQVGAGGERRSDCRAQPMM